MVSYRPNTYKGFEMYVVIYPHAASFYQQHGPRGLGYDSAIRISRAGADAGSATSRVFKIKHGHAFEQLGEAYREAMKHGERIVDGKVEGESVADF